MAHPDIRPVASPADETPASRPARRAPIAEREGEPSIIGRRDVAIVPWVTIAMVAVAVAASTALRPDGDLSDGLVIAGALAYAVVAGVLAVLQDQPIARRMRDSLPVYLFGSALLVGLLAATASLDQGLRTVFFAPIVQVAAYLGLVLPRRWSRISVVTLLATVAVVQALNPAASAQDAATMFGLVVAAWLVGVLCHSAHGRAARIALLLSRSDALTATLNRRGFFDQFDAELAATRETQQPVALLVIDLDGFKVVNDDLGHAAGDELLAWVGRTIPTQLPPDAALGRLGGDEFGIVLPGSSRREAEATAGRIVDVLAGRIGASIGVASTQDPETTADDLLRVADAALYAAKAVEGAQVHSLVAGSTRTLAADPPPARPPLLTYARLRAAGGPPERPAQGIHYGWLLRGTFWVVAASGALIIGGIALAGAANAYERLLLIIGLPWILANVVLGWVNFGVAEVLGRRIAIARYASANLVGAGVALAMLAGGGITAPIVAGLYLKVLFDASVLARREARETTAITLAWWLLAVVLGPRAELWAVPYQLTLFAVSYGLGIVARRSFTDAISARLRLAHTDALTGLRNRPGFAQGAERAFAAAQADGRPFAIIAFDLDDFKSVNDTLGHAAGDDLLQQVAELTKATLPSAYSVGRLGGDEFVAAVPAGSVEEAGALATALAVRLRTVVGASIGCAVYPADGADLEALLRSADHHSYSAKPGRMRHSPLSVAAPDPGIAAA